MCVCLSVCYFLLDHWRDRNEIFRGRRHHALEGYYISKTCYYVTFKVICEKLSSRKILVSYSYLLCTGDILTYLLPPFLPPTSNLPFYLQPPYLPPIFYLQPPFLPLTSLSISYLPFYLLPSLLASTVVARWPCIRLVGSSSPRPGL